MAPSGSGLMRQFTDDDMDQRKEHVMHDSNFYPFHLFAARFMSTAQAHDFTFEHWEPEPCEQASDADYAAWEARNPRWLLAQELGFYMDSDFVELVDSLESIQGLIASEAEKERLCAQARAGFSHFIVVGSQAIYGDRRASSPGQPVREPEATRTLQYLGRFN